MNEADFQRLLDASAAETRKSFAEMREHVDLTAAETRRYMDVTTAETRRYMDVTTAETRKHFDATVADIHHKFEIKTEHLDAKIQLVVETVALLDEKVDREAASIRDEMRRGFADTQAMIKFSHAELDRRIQRLEASTQ
jgi:hypothetical protein